MAEPQRRPETLEQVRQFVEAAALPGPRRTGRSATERLCAICGVAAIQVSAKAPSIRALLATARPAQHGLSEKSWANLVSRFRQELRLAGVIDPNWQTRAARHPVWGVLVRAISADKCLANGLAGFLNWCAVHDIVPVAVDDALVQQFYLWLEQRTLCPKPRDLVRQTPRLWNLASERVETWPKAKLTIISFKAPFKRLQWGELPERFRADADAYLAMRANPDPFDERPNAPTRPLAASTLQQQKAHIRLSVSVLVENGMPLEEVVSLAVLIEPERFKTVLRHFHEQAGGRPNAFVVCLAKTLIQIAHHYLDFTPDQEAPLKRAAKKLLPVPHELTGKNKALLRQLESDQLRAELMFLPDRLISEVTKGLAEGKLEFVKAQVAVAIGFELAIPLRPQNLCRLNWGKHFLEPEGPKGRMLLHIPKQEIKSRKEFDAEIPEHVVRLLRWYRQEILPRLGGDSTGALFVNRKGKLKGQDTFTDQIIKTIEHYLGIHMSVHQFRHFAGYSYLEENPDDFETAKSLLGHGWSKTTKIYVGSDTRRASRAYNNFVFEQREALRLKRKRQRKRNPKKEPVDA